TGCASGREPWRTSTDTAPAAECRSASSWSRDRPERDARSSASSPRAAAERSLRGAGRLRDPRQARRRSRYLKSPACHQVAAARALPDPDCGHAGHPKTTRIANKPRILTRCTSVEDCSSPSGQKLGPDSPMQPVDGKILAIDRKELAEALALRDTDQRGVREIHRQVGIDAHELANSGDVIHVKSEEFYRATGKSSPVSCPGPVQISPPRTVPIRSLVNRCAPRACASPGPSRDSLAKP